MALQHYEEHLQAKKQVRNLLKQVPNLSKVSLQPTKVGSKPVLVEWKPVFLRTKLEITMNKEEEPEYTPKNINEVLICIVKYFISEKNKNN